MNNDNLRPVDTLVWLSTVFTHQLIELNLKNLNANESNANHSKMILENLEKINESLLTLIDKIDNKGDKND